LISFIETKIDTIRENCLAPIFFLGGCAKNVEKMGSKDHSNLTQKILSLSDIGSEAFQRKLGKFMSVL